MSTSDTDNDDPADPGDASAAAADSGPRGTLLEGLIKRAGKVAGGTLDIAMDVASMSAMFGDSWVRDLVSSSASPERLEAMAEAGRFLRDTRETAGLSLQELADRLELNDEGVLKGVEAGEAILPLEIMLRSVSLLARHDPVPFLIKFLRSYNPGLEATLEQWGVMALPKNFERERRFINLYRQHDFLRELSDEEHQRFIEYMDASTKLVVEVMQREASASRAPAETTPKKKARTRSNTEKKPVKRKSPAAKRPVVRKVKPRSGKT